VTESGDSIHSGPKQGTKMLRAIFLLCLTVAVYGNGGTAGHGHGSPAAAHDASGNSTGDCNGEIQVCTDCILDSVKKNQDRVMEQFKNKKTELEACFTANKCTVPQPKSHAAAAADPDAMKKMKCGVAMMKKRHGYSRRLRQERIS